MKCGRQTSVVAILDFQLCACAESLLTISGKIRIILLQKETISNLSDSKYS